jgi:Leucine-rich repeat (LRR) protein
MRNLKRLVITRTPIIDLTPLINNHNIEVIIADNTEITTQEVIALKEKQRQVTVVYQTRALQQWWNKLDDIWKAIFSNEFSMQYNTNAPSSLELQKINDLREINISSNYPISNLEPLRNCIWLEKLDISNQSVRDLSPLENKQYLKELYVQNTPITSLKPLENDLQMKILNIENTQIDDLGPISKMTNLVTLNAGGTSIKSLKPLQNLENLENLYINNTSVKNLSPIENLPKLKTLKAYNTKLNNKKIESLQQKRLDLNIIYY